MSSMVPNCCLIPTFNELGFPFWKKDADEVVDDLFVTIQHILAGTATVSKKMISETCLEWKIQLNPNSPVILLQYELKAKKNGMTHLIPVIDCKQIDEKITSEEDVNIVHESIITFDGMEDKSTLLWNLKQETPELLSVLNNNGEIKYKPSFSSDCIQKNQTKCTSSEIDKNSISISESIENSENRMVSNVENGLMAGKSTMTILQPEEENPENKTFDERSNSETCKADVNSGGERYTCEDSGKSFSWLSYLSIDTDENPFKCEICHESFTSLINMKHHKYIHTGENPLKCAECGISFTQFSTLTRHMRTHKGENPFKCEICKKSFTSLINMKCHKYIHTGESPLKCDECGISFTKFSTLAQHMKTHRGDKSFKCEICMKSFPSSDNLFTHKKIHTGEKPFKCGECGRSFSQLCTLTQHMRIHTGKKLFKCDQCDKNFISKSLLTVHERNHTGEKPFKCDHCDKTFRTSGNLTLHERIHTGEKPFTCDHCGKSFRNSSNLRRHRKIHI